MEVRVKYSADSFPQMEAPIEHAAGRMSDFSGMGFGERDHGWVCESEIEAEKISQALKRIGLKPVIRK